MQTNDQKVQGAQHSDAARPEQALKAPVPQQQEETTHKLAGTDLKNFVSFYFTNVPEGISNVSLRKGFEVCGILEDVYLARKRNVNGRLFGFVRFCKVRDVDKLLKALNNVWFGDCRVVAKVASFDRFGNKNTYVVTWFEGEKSIEEEKKVRWGMSI